MAKILELQHKENVAILSLQNGVTNALTPSLVSEFNSAIYQFSEDAQALVLCGNEKFFSIGLSLPDLLKYGRGEMEDFWQSFNDLILSLYTLPFPVVCAIQGHAVAGGAILALTADLRLAAEGKSKIGLNEISLGIPVPLLADMLLKQVVGQQEAVKLAYSGTMIGAEQAHQVGLIDEIHPSEILFDAAVAKASTMGGARGPAFAVMKRGYTEAVVDRYKQKGQTYDTAFLDIWFSEPVQEVLTKAAENF